MAITAAVRLLTSTLCLLTATTAFAQSVPTRQPFPGDVARVDLTEGPIRKAAREAVVQLPPSSPPSPQQSTAGRKTSATAWGAVIGAAAGVVGGLVQPTHSNGEYVLGNSRGTSAVVLGGVGAGVGALMGFAIDRGRKDRQPDPGTAQVQRGPS